MIFFSKYNYILKMSIVVNKHKLYKDVVGVICNFLPKYKLRDWVDEKKLHFSSLCENPSPGAIEIIEEEYNRDPNSERISWRKLCRNPSAIHLIEKELKRNPDSNRINWRHLCKNPNAVHLIEEELKINPDSKKINYDSWCSLSQNLNAVHLIEKNLDKFTHESQWAFSYANPNILHLLENKLDNLTCSTSILNLLKNPNPKAFQAIKQKFNISNSHYIHVIAENTNPEVLNLINLDYGTGDRRMMWCNLSANPSAFHLIKNRLYNVDWVSLSENPNAIHVLEKASTIPSLLNYNHLSKNPAIFELAKLDEILMHI